jgi:hypothetical protein
LFEPENQYKKVAPLRRKPVAPLGRKMTAAMESSGYADTAPMRVRSGAITSPIDFVEDNRYDAVTVRDICKNTNVSIRTLDRAFKERWMSARNWSVFAVTSVGQPLR